MACSLAKYSARMAASRGFHRAGTCAIANYKDTGRLHHPTAFYQGMGLSGEQGVRGQIRFLSAFRNQQQGEGARFPSTHGHFLTGGLLAALLAATAANNNKEKNSALCELNRPIVEMKQKSLHSKLMDEVEPYTQTTFPAAIQSEDMTIVQDLLSVSVRCMLGLCAVSAARVYAFGLYADLRGWKGLNSSSSDDEIIEQLLRESSSTHHDDYPVVGLRIVLGKNVAGHHLAKGFNQSLLPRVRIAQNGEKQGRGKTALKRFVKLFTSQAEWKKGTDILFTRRGDGSLVVSIDGSEVLWLDSSELSWAILDTYFGKKGHFSSKAKQEICEKVRELKKQQELGVK